MSELKKVWQQIEKYLTEGFSIIPVADRELTHRGKSYHPKQAILQWEPYQKNIIPKQKLWQEMDDALIAAVAIVTGKVSGSLEVIDIDVKYSPGIDAVLFQDIKLLYPDLFKKLRIHKSPSGGAHILYRIGDHDVPGNLKLAGRPSTESELSTSKQKTKNFIETRGEGGYVVAPPSMGYSVINEVPVPVITWQERSSLIAICESYNQIVKVDKLPKPTRTEETYYDENPFEHFNNTCDPVALMDGFGWQEFKHNSRFVWFTRPGTDKQGKNATVSASFNLQKRVFYIFTSSTDLEPAKGYLPSTIVAELQFAGDKKKTYAYLVEKGYGKVRPAIERRTIKITAVRGGKLPPNFSKGAADELTKEVEHLQQQYPHGIFWYEEDDYMKISREALVNVAKNLGFYLDSDDIVRIEGYTVFKISDRVFFDSIKEYIKEEDHKTLERIYNSYEAFLQASGKFTISRLPILEKDRFVQDDRLTCFKFYNNGYLAITSDRITMLDYNTIHGLVWANEIADRDFKEGSGGLYVDFLYKALDFNKYPDHIKKVLGWLAHNYKDETTAYIIALTEACPDPKQGGGSGKNLFCNLLRETTSYASINGGQVTKYDEAFLQSWNGERLFCISDPKKGFDWGFLKEFASGVGVIKKLWHDHRSLSVADLPKMMVATNFSYEITDGGLKRRIVGLEFTDFFTRSGGVDRFYGKMFPIDWAPEDWAGYDNLIAESIQLWLASNLKLSQIELTEGGWFKQFDQSFGQLTREFIQENWDYWLRIYFVSNETFKQEYETFCNNNNINHQWRLTSMKMNAAIAAWCEHHGQPFEKEARSSDEYRRRIRGKSFGEEKLPF